MSKSRTERNIKLINRENILDRLAAVSDERYKANVVKLGIPEEKSLGVSTGDVRKLAKELKKELKKEPEACGKLAGELWDSGFHEARILAALLMDGKSMKLETAELLMADVVSWDLCDHLCKNLLVDIPGYPALAEDWRDRPETYFKRAAFTLIATIMIREKAVSQADADRYLGWIKSAAEDEREHVKKAVSWALREIGKRDFDLLEKAVETAHELCVSGGKAEKWIGKDALKELEKLTAVEGRRRLISTDSQMGKEKGRGGR